LLPECHYQANLMLTTLPTGRQPLVPVIMVRILLKIARQSGPKM